MPVSCSLGLVARPCFIDGFSKIQTGRWGGGGGGGGEGGRGSIEGGRGVEYI